MMCRFIKVLLSSVVISLFLFISSSQSVYAESQTNCTNRYVTLVNPVRGRDLWSDKSLKPIIDQYAASANYNFPTTWLLQYDALADSELINVIKDFKVSGEKGVFLEISKSLAEDARVMYDPELKWSNPGVVFLSAYSQSERRALIDALYIRFKTDFGYYPKSVGAWWIDSYSLNYIKEKYGLDAVLIVADQKTTDSYGVWGQWWGYPYYPSKYNVLTPGVKEKLDAVVIQWAQRDPILAYGEGPEYSNFSLQANDYIRSSKNTEYFKTLINSYLDCQNSVGQITVGLETGMESVGFHKEYLNQLKALSEYKDLKFLTMSDFAKEYKKINKQNPSKVVIDEWNMSTDQRSNETLGDKVNYRGNISFGDYYVSDKNNFLNRNLVVISTNGSAIEFPWFILVSFALLTISLWKRKFAVWICSMLFAFISFGLIFRSGVVHGWLVFYGPVIGEISLVQCLSVLITFIVFSLLFLLAKTKLKKTSLFLWLLPLSFGLDRILMAFRYSVIDGNHAFGFLIERTRVLGLMVGEVGLKLFNENFLIVQAQSFLKLPFDKIWQNTPIYFVLYPLAHILAAGILYFLLVRLPKRMRVIFLTLLVILFIAQVIWIFKVDPVSVLAITN